MSFEPQSGRYLAGPDAMLERTIRIREHTPESTSPPGALQEGLATLPQPMPVGRSVLGGGDRPPSPPTDPEPLNDNQTREVAAALEVWKKGLLTVSGASRLVNYRPTKLRSVAIESPSPDEILAWLDSGRLWGFQGQQPAEPDATSLGQEPDRGPGQTPPRATSDSALQCSRPDKDLGSVLRSIMRLANTEWLDRGLRVLYLAFGMLHWRDVDGTEYTSPLVLVPVELIPLGPKDVPRLSAADDERVLNPALRVQLERFGIDLPDADKLDGLDVESQLAVVQDIAARQGWRVTGDMVLAMFSFHKEAMYKDLVENAQTILEHPIVRILGTSDPLKQSRALDFEPISPADIDRLAPPETTPVLLDADSSQRAAIAAAVAGRSFVMDGPPGTGKSQTIANMVGALLHAGKSVLFVSEKAAALEVVRNRLEHLGMLPYLFELHSSRTSRKEVAVELLRSLETKPVAPAGMDEHDRALAARGREALNAYASAMNAIRHPLEKSLHDVLGRISQLAESPHAPIPASGAQSISGETYAVFKDLVSTLHLSWRPAEQGSSFLWKDVVGQRPIDELLFLARHCLEDLSGAMKLNEDVASSFELVTPSQAGSMVTLLELQHGARPEGVLASWLTCESLSDLDATIAQLQQALRAIRGSDNAWRDATGTDWSDNATLAELSADQQSSGKQAHFDTGPLTATDCLAAAHDLEELNVSLSQGRAGASRLAEALGLPAVETTRDIDRVLSLVDQCSAAYKPSRHWFSGQSTALLRREMDALEASSTELARLEAEAKPYFTDAALHAPVEELLTRFREEYKGLKKLSAAYRADKKRVSELLASDVAVAEGIRGLEKAVSWTKAHFAFQTQAETQGPTLDSYWLGRSTSFSQARLALSVVDGTHAALADLPLNDRLVHYLTTDEGRTLVGVGSEVRRHMEAWRRGFQPGGALFAHQPLALQPMADIVAWLQIQSRQANHDANRIQGVDLAAGRLHTKQQADWVLGLWAQSRAARAVVQSDGLRYRTELGELYSGAETDLGLLDAAVAWARQLRAVVGAPLSRGQVAALQNARANQWLVPAKQEWEAAVDSLVGAFSANRHPELRAELDDFDGAVGLISEFESDPGGQAEWFRYAALRSQLARLGLDEAVNACVAQRIPREHVPGALEKALLRGWANSVMADDTRLNPASEPERKALIEQYRLLDTDLIHSANSRIILAVNSRRPQFLGMGEQGVIQREGMKKKRHVAVRELIGKTKATVLSLKPCFMMSPLAVSQYLPPDIRFDVVIFDEASQVTPSDAVNCVYRGNALILAGDEKQLPPTSFFEKMDDGELDDESTDVKDFDSILELAKASGAIRNIPLRWHYRSADDGLINYSNYKFYEGKLVVFPSPGSESGEPAVTFHKVDGIYRRGATADNPLEAEAVAARVMQHFTKTPDQSLGVVTFSVAQATAVQDAIDRARENRRDLDQYFDVSERLNAFFVKSLESVQGDERDKIIFSIGYGPDENGKTTTNFGVLNRDKGWRRLNVAVTRARRKVEVVSSMRAGDLPPSPNENVEYLRAYLDYADRGMPALAINLGTSGASPDSPFEESVLAVLTRWGYAVEPQVGSAGYRIDIGVRHPSHPGLFLLGIECDGFQYHSAPAARDRDRLREQVLRRLGWNLHRIWGTSWYRDRDGQEARLRRALDDALIEEAPKIPELRRPAVELGFEPVERMEQPAWATKYLEAAVSPLPRWIEVSEAGAGFDMAAGVHRVIQVEGPVHVDILHQRLRDAWDIGRIGNKIRDNINSAIKHAGVLREGDFLLLPGSRDQRVRTPSEMTIRKVEQIHHHELAVAMTLLLSEMGSATTDQLILGTARLFGWNRTGSGIQSRLEPIIDDLAKVKQFGREGEVLTLLEKQV